MLDLRVARTMGTTDEQQWKCQTANTPGDQFMVKVDGDQVLGVGLRGSAAISMRFAEGIFSMTYLESTSVSFQTWRCAS